MKPIVNHSEIVHQNPWYKIRHDKLTWPNGKPGNYYVIETPETACVIAERDEKILIARQYRHTLDAISMEFPGGAIDRNETPTQAAARELQEETGWKAGKLDKLGTLQVLGGLGNIRMHVFLATDLSETEKHHEDSEDGLETVWLTKKEWEDAIRRGEGVDSESLAAWVLYLSNNR
jgi:8-oxo-dGTP pyrophosphatase MutT (NUDIX family)